MYKVIEISLGLTSGLKNSVAGELESKINEIETSNPTWTLITLNHIVGLGKIQTVWKTE